ncbi:hypothetical protein F442_02001, partial [Phytophthora nicotianae P10297]
RDRTRGKDAQRAQQLGEELQERREHHRQQHTAQGASCRDSNDREQRYPKKTGKMNVSQIASSMCF